MMLRLFLLLNFRTISPLSPKDILVKLEKPKLSNFWASANLISPFGACMITAINDKSSLVALADKLYSARDVEPVFSPSTTVHSF